jgi:general stress protein 26
LLATADGNGLPHMTWMNTVVGPRLEEVITATAPHTLKVANLGANSRVEWMFSSSSMETLVYLTGKATILTDEAEAEACWNHLPGKAQAYFRNYCVSDDFRDFSLIRTVVNEVVYCRPQGYRKTLVYQGVGEDVT